ncbi:hypothetical protein SOM26_14655 [Sphingomonas sp. CFBP8993]|uniref:hypothetical protein n=1 Tax=Sphingomonas sp. CFBP8993 TaxID=3096526 RepID=UPI002A69A124|nr:hypothetical protein [Sphingomonas sp. CFBP8993]MDY0959932.1 hypothetical protein [Sphingomonas sp. CFBP8993]
MIDTFALLVSHGLMLLAAWRLLARRDLDKEGDVRTLDRKRPDDARWHRDA